MLAVSCGKAFAASLVSSLEDAWTGTEDRTPDLADLFAETDGLCFFCGPVDIRVRVMSRGVSFSIFISKKKGIGIGIRIRNKK